MIFLLLTITICKYIDIGKTYEDKLLKQDTDIRGHSYHFELKYLKENADVLIILSQLTPQGDPNIFVSKQNESPFSIEESELVYCSSLGNDLCVIDKSQLEMNTYYYIGITCQGDCYYTLKVDYDLEQYLEMDDVAQFKMSQTQQSIIIKIKLKTVEDLQELQILGKILNFHEMENPFYMYLNLGDTLPSSQSHHFKGEVNKNGNQIISLPLISIENLSILTLIVEAQTGSFIEIKTKVISNVTRHLILTKIDGYVGVNQTNLFEIDEIYRIGNQTQFYLEIFFELIFGEVLIGIEIQKQLPSNISNFLYVFQTNQTMVLSLPKFEIDLQNEDNFIFVAVKGIESSSFQFTTFTIPNLNPVTLQTNVLYTGILSGESVNNYCLQTYFNAINDKFTIKFYPKSDNLILALQTSDSFANFSTKDFQQIEKQQSNETKIFFTFTTNNITELKFEITKENENIFFYIVSVFQNPQNIQEENFQYSFILETSIQGEILLSNTPHKMFGHKNQYSYFNYNLNVTHKINKVIIMITTIQGKCQIFSSKQKYPNSVEFEKKGVDNLIEYDFKNTFQKHQIFYISVLSEIAGYFIVTVILKIDGLDAYGDFPWEYTQIYQGNPAIYTLNKNKTVELLKIDFSEYKRQIQNAFKHADFAKVHLMSSEAQGLHLYGFTSPSSIVSNSIWSGESSINLLTSDFYDDMIVYLRIELQQNYNYSSFKIAYVLKRSILQDISENENYFGCLDYHLNQNFLFKYFDKKNYVIIIKNEGSEEKISTYVEHLHNSPNDSIIFLTDQYLEELNCIGQEKKEFMCFQIISIKSSKFTFFSMLIVETSQQQQLFPGQKKYLETPTFQNYFYSFVNNDHVEIIVTSFQQNIKFLILISIYEKKTHLEVKEYPQNENQENYVQTTMVNNNNLQYAKVTITRKEMSKKECSQCALAITIQSVEENKQVNSYNIYSIFVQPLIQHLYEGIEAVAQVANLQFLFYQLQVQRPQVQIEIKLSKCIKTTIFVSKNELPSQEKFDWFTDSNQIIIKNKKEKHFDMSGKYFIGVLGQKDECTYNIKYELSELKNDTSQLKKQVSSFQLNPLENNQKEFITTQDPVTWQMNSSKTSFIIIQLLFQSNVKVEGGFSNENLRVSKNLSKFTVMRKTKEHVFGYFNPKQDGVFYIQTQSNNNYSLRVTQLFTNISGLNFEFGKLFATFDQRSNYNFSKIETSVDYIQLMQKNLFYQIQEIQIKIQQIQDENNISPVLSNQKPLLEIILHKNEELQQIGFPLNREQISLNNSNNYLMQNEILITLNEEEVLIIDTFNYYSLILKDKNVVQATDPFNIRQFMIIAIGLLAIIYITFKKKKRITKENQAMKMVEMRLKVIENKQ